MLIILILTISSEKPFKYLMILQKVTVRHGTMLSEKDFLIYLLFLSRSLDIIYLALSEVLLVLSVLTGYKT